jgi:hypothetical protein
MARGRKKEEEKESVDMQVQCKVAIWKGDGFDGAQQQRGSSASLLHSPLPCKRMLCLFVFVLL